MADENDNNTEKESSNSNINYQRKKNLIPGLDNDHLIIGMLGLLGAAVVAPHLKGAIDNIVRQYQPQFPQQQLPQPNNGMQQPVYLPPNVQSVEHQHEHLPERPAELIEHERNLKEQQAYEAAMEKESVTGSSSMSMVPDRSTNVSNKNKNKGNYEAGSNISGSYS